MLLSSIAVTIKVGDICNTRQHYCTKNISTRSISVINISTRLIDAASEGTSLATVISRSAVCTFVFVFSSPAFIWWSVLQSFASFLCDPNSYSLSTISLPYCLLCSVWLSPLLLLVSAVRTAVSTPLGLLVLRLVLLGGIASFQFQEPHSHAVGMGVAMSAATIILCSKLWDISQIDR